MRHKRFLLLSLILFLLCQTNLFGALIAASFGAVILIEAIGFFNETRKVTQWQFGMSLFLLTSGIAVFLYTAYMPRDTVWPWGSRFFVTFSLERLYDTFCNTNRAYFPYLTSAIKKYGGIFYFKEMNFIFSLLEFLFCCLIFLRRPKIFLLYFLSTLSLMVVFYMSYGMLRHLGHLFIVLIICFWLSTYIDISQFKNRLLNKVIEGVSRYTNIFLTAILLLHFIGGCVFYIIDIIEPYSAAKETAEFIKSNKMDRMIIAGDIDYSVSSIAGYLDKQIYYPRGERFGSHIFWDIKRAKELSPEEIILSAEKLAQRNRQDILLILNYEPNANILPPHIRKIKQFTRALQKDEIYYLYIVPFRNHGLNNTP